ncbi:xanthine dehydrogenase small subunit [Ramlibacter tataouinensis]|uniref:Candidate xanthine dehydrogenase small subunit n=1 Tax=Ramlibacter tataouinensis (strain ATCC BAA-407 / DSM 14655 / LMG 21543 / TTB310) TaxID=365046 RepID=F5XY25_RAMTT|nr:xanthine dehydrogenase small subunit [Ramlibacter tataouinensis]AEG94350.1 Candidate xanthine dehydrogenase small subunit [Ramlibacter tataouinensis TTB310]
MEARTIRFIRRGEVVSAGNVPPDRTLLELLREDLGATGTKEGCGEGDCGACTVVVAEPAEPQASHGPGGLRYKAINSCIRLAHSVDGLALWTVEDLQAADGTLHPAQEALVRCHGSQCGFCTPGFVMSLFGMYQNHVCQGRPVTRELAQAELSGNLCRCTGYRPILDAAQQMAQLPAVRVDEQRLAAQLQAIHPAAVEDTASAGAAYWSPERLDSLLSLRAAHPQAQLVAGCTDVGLWVTKRHLRFGQVLDLTRVEELRRIARVADGGLAIGAAVTLTDAFAALVAQRPQLKAFGERFAGLPVRNSGTLGGNIANGSPIGDSMPLLIALGARLVLASRRGERELALEDFYTGYRQTVLAPDEVVARILVPVPAAGEFLRAYKISKRFDDDISAVCLVVRLVLDAHNTIRQVGIGAGGVAATPARARRTEALLLDKGWTEQAALEAAASLRAEFQPISDMRASADYRRQVLGNLMRRLWLESQGQAGINLESLRLQEVTG